VVCEPSQMTYPRFRKKSWADIFQEGEPLSAENVC
jgi:hypothetical protein